MLTGRGRSVIACGPRHRRLLHVQAHRHTSTNPYATRPQERGNARSRSAARARYSFVLPTREGEGVRANRLDGGRAGGPVDGGTGRGRGRDRAGDQRDGDPARASTTPRRSCAGGSRAISARSTQASYRVVVATTAAKAAAGQGDVWDSGEVASSAQAVDYAGPALASRTRYFWSVRVASEWAAPTLVRDRLPEPERVEGRLDLRPGAHRAAHHARAGDGRRRLLPAGQLDPVHRRLGRRPDRCGWPTWPGSAPARPSRSTPATPRRRRRSTPWAPGPAPRRPCSHRRPATRI